MKENVKKLLGVFGRIVVFLFFLLFAYFRMFNLIPILVGILFIWRDSKRYGHILGWLLVFVGFGGTILYYILYSVEGGLLY